MHPAPCVAPCVRSRQAQAPAQRCSACNAAITAQRMATMTSQNLTLSSSGGFDITIEKRRVATQPARFLVGCAESPATRAKPAKILQRTTGGNELPIQHPDQSRTIYHQIARAKITMAQTNGLGIGTDAPRPGGGVFQCRTLGFRGRPNTPQRSHDQSCSGTGSAAALAADNTWNS